MQSQSTSSSQTTVHHANTANAINTSDNTQVMVDRDTLRQGMSALLPSGDYDIEDLTDSLLATISD